jgi:rod shape determining protein RodA
MAHIFVNSAMASGLMPVKGLPLPFISYGGSFLVSSFMMVGLILNFGREEI